MKKSYSWLDSTGQIIKTKTIKEFAETYNFPPSMARTLSSGVRARLRGFCSTSPRAKKLRDRFMTELVNTKTGERCILGPTIKKFAEDRGLCTNEVNQLLNGHRFIYRHWCLAKTVERANEAIPAPHF